jgi:ribosomal protein S18 acetylase RimI-like enzyme
MVALFVEDPSPHEVNLAGALRTLDVLGGEPVRGVAVVLEDDDAIAGYAILASFWSNELGGEICVVDELYVKPASRGRGLATWLVRELMARNTAWFKDAVAVELEVTPANVRARALYERLGFKPKKNAVLRWTDTK